MNDTIRVVLCTCPSEEVAEAVAQALIAEDHAACVNVVPGITSIYQWRNEIHRDSEVLMVIKTTEKRYPAMEKRIEEIHPYDVPEIIAMPISGGLPSYLNWVRGGGD
jgi:periplasmic divalent cation tolerance protein